MSHQELRKHVLTEVGTTITASAYVTSLCARRRGKGFAGLSLLNPQQPSEEIPSPKVVNPGEAEPGLNPDRLAPEFTVATG